LPERDAGLRRSCLEWDAKGEVRVRSPIRVLVPALLLALRPEVRALVREARR